VLVLALAGCGLEQGFSKPIPQYPFSVPPALPDETQVDTILQVTTPQVDILWMIDNSCSMYNEQTDLTDNIPFFMQYFVGSGLDYHVAVTSSDTISSDYSGSSGTLVEREGRTYIDTDVVDAVGLFVKMATLGTTGRFPERGLGATYTALELKRNTTNAGFYRDNAALHTIIISDEPDFTESFVITVPEYQHWYSDLKEPEDRTFSAIIDMQRGADYKSTAEYVGGILWDLKDDDWPRLLDGLGLQAAGLSREYFLSRLPVPGSIEVTVITPAEVELSFDEAKIDPDTGALEDKDMNGLPDGDWTYAAGRNSITFLEFVPEALSKVVLTYKPLASQHPVE
jgi:hypothetical protein